MIKFSNAFIFIIPSLLALACSGSKNQETAKTQSAPTEVATTEESGLEVEAQIGDTEASSSLYLDDMVDSGTTAVDAKDTATDSVKEDLKAANLKAAAQRLLDELDTDDSGTLTKTEFLAILTKAGSKSAGLSAEKLAEVKAKFEASFDAAKGDDELLSLDELQTLVKAHAARVSKFRDGDHKGSRSERVGKSFAEILKKFDTNGDGVLDKDEQLAMHAELKKECKANHDKLKTCPVAVKPVVTPPAATPAAASVTTPPAATPPATTPPAATKDAADCKDDADAPADKAVIIPLPAPAVPATAPAAKSQFNR